MSTCLGNGSGRNVSSSVGRPAVLPSIECDYCAPIWEDGVRPDLARFVLVVHEPADKTSASVALQDPELKSKRTSGHSKRVNPQTTIVLKSQTTPISSGKEPSIPPELEAEVDKLVRDYAHLRYFPPRQDELAVEFEVLSEGISLGRIKAIAKRWNGGSGVRYPVRIGLWLGALRENIANKGVRQVC